MSAQPIEILPVEFAEAPLNGQQLAPMSATSADLMSWDARIERAIMDPAFDLSRLERMIQLRDTAVANAERREAAERADRERRAFNLAMIAAQSEMAPVIKNAENTHTKSVYATLDAIAAAIDPVIMRHGFAQSFSTCESPVANCIRITCRTLHSAGHEQLDIYDSPLDGQGSSGNANKTPTHARGSAITYGRRYLKLMIFDIKTRLAMPDDDGIAAGGSAPSEPDAIGSDDIAYVRRLLRETASDEAAFLRAAKADSVETLTPRQFKWAVDRLNQKRAMGAGK